MDRNINIQKLGMAVDCEENLKSLKQILLKDREDQIKYVEDRK